MCSRAGDYASKWIFSNTLKRRDEIQGADKCWLQFNFLLNYCTVKILVSQ